MRLAFDSSKAAELNRHIFEVSESFAQRRRRKGEGGKERGERRGEFVY